jgi:hypothetical protein
MKRSRRYVIVGGSVLALAAGGAGAALALYPGGHANAVERDSEDGATWEVEVAKPDGGTVDVRLDQAYQLVVAETDSEDQGGN